ncbi:MAG: GGDEF domain-containing protein [Spirochaetales bacterium]|nr:GGDEF domain-containing protein [Spirochaetales bacterium]
MRKDYLQAINSNPDVIANYELLKRIGIWDQIVSLEKEVHAKDKLLEEVVQLFNQASLIGLITFITDRMLDRFVPSYLAFVLQEEGTGDKVHIICFRNLKRVKNLITIESIIPYRQFFSSHSGLMTFDQFAKTIANPKLSEPLNPLNPELVMPLMGLGGMYGFIVFGRKIIDEVYSEQELEYIDWIMKCASVSLQTNIYYQRAIIDSKTQLYTHHFFIKRLQEELSRISRYKEDLALLMFDIDHFKELNDSFGHLAGDRVLFDVAEILKTNIRKSDVAARFGGEEFVVLLISCNKDYAYMIAERIRSRIEDMDFEYLGAKIKVTISAGISFTSQKNVLTEEELIRQSDLALYASKRKGRNCSTLYSGKLDEE